MCNNENTMYWVREDWTGRYFRGNIPTIEKAVSEANSFLHREGDVDLNTFYNFLGLEEITPGTTWGWSGDEIVLTYGTAFGGPLAPPSAQGAPIISIQFRNEPKPHLGVS